MKWKSLAHLAAASLFATANAFAVVTIADGRCGGWGDSLEQGAQTDGRVAFALKCEKNDEIRADIQQAYDKGLGRTSSGAVTKGYPTYGMFDPVTMSYVNPRSYRAPTDASAPCTDIPPGYKVVFLCGSGCYTAEQTILFPGGFESIAEAKQKDYRSIMALDASSTLDAPALKESPVGDFIADVVPGRQEILDFRTASGAELRVTKNHPLVDGQGYIRRASDFQVGDFLVKANGHLDPISSVNQQVIHDRVYNVSVDSNDPREQIVVAQGFLNGSLYYQNEGVKKLNRELLRTNIAADLVRE